MVAIIFNGKSFVSQKESDLIKEIERLRGKNIVPKLTSILVGDNPASVLYLNLKKKKAEKVGVAVDILKFETSVRFDELIHEIRKLNRDNSVHGIMIQLPLPSIFSKSQRDKIINAIAKKKDVDGLREDSPYLTPTVKAVLSALKEASNLSLKKDDPNKYKVVVVGYKGFEGRKIFKVFKDMGYDVEGVDKKTEDLGLRTKSADVLISATGSRGLITKDMLKKGAVVIDVGAPHGDVKLKEVSEKVAFISPVPGGVGPMTIYYLLENLTAAAAEN